MMTYYINVLFAMLVTVSCEVANAEWASSDQMAEDALIPYVGTKDVVVKAARIAHRRRVVMDGARLEPDRRRSASIVFNKPYRQRQLVAFALANDFDVLFVHLKAPLSEIGVINSVGIGLDDLFIIEGTFPERLGYAIDLQRARMIQMAGRLPGIEGDEYRTMAEGDQRIFVIDVIGTSRSLAQVANRADIAGIFQDNHERKIEGYKEHRNRRFAKGKKP